MMFASSEDLLADPIGRYPFATVACFDATTGELPRRALDESRNAEFLERLAEAGVPAVLIAASTGHGQLRTCEELAKWFASAAAARLGNTTKMALLRPEDGTHANEKLVDQLAQLGYQVVYVRPGTNLARDAGDEQIAANMRPIVMAAANHGMAIGVYSISDVSSLPLTPEATELLVAGPGGKNIVAVKVTEADYETSTKRFLENPRLEHLKIVQGWDPHLARALKDGGRHCGVTSGSMSFAVHQYLHIFEAAAQADWDEVAAAQAAVTVLFESMQDDPTKFADLQRAKYIMGLGHPLTGNVVPEQVERVFLALENLPRRSDQSRLAQSLDLMESGPFHERLKAFYAAL